MLPGESVEYRIRFERGSGLKKEAVETMVFWSEAGIAALSGHRLNLKD